MYARTRTRAPSDGFLSPGATGTFTHYYYIFLHTLHLYIIGHLSTVQKSMSTIIPIHTYTHVCVCIIYKTYILMTLYNYNSIHTTCGHDGH